MKRDNIEFMVGWLDALRRDDREALLALLEPDVVWQGLKEEWVCHGAQDVVDTFTGQRDEAREIDALELIGAEDHAILHARGAGVLELALADGIYNVFAIHAGRVTRIDDYAQRQAALAAAGLAWGDKGERRATRS
jgi:ketosteroid isomerase-like protein